MFNQLRARLAAIGIFRVIDKPRTADENAQRERDALLPKYTCPGCGRKTMVFGFEKGSGGVAEAAATFHGRCTNVRCGYVSRG